MRAPFLLAALLVTIAPSAQADAPPTDCARPLAGVRSGTTTGCDTYGNAFGGYPALRRVSLVVTSGAATATQYCGGWAVTSATVTVTGPGTQSAFVLQSGGYCWVTVTATAPLTTAVVASSSAERLEIGG